MRFAVVKKPKLLKRLEVRLVKAVWGWQRAQARRHGATGALTGGGVCFWQWFGLSLQLTPHLHLLTAEALWQVDGTVVPAAPPADEDVARILARVLRQAKKDWAELEEAWPEDEYEALQLQAIQERLGLLEPAPRHRARQLAVLHGFSLHADTAVHAHDRQGLERLCRYGARGPVAESRLRRLEDGRYEYSPKKGAAFSLTACALVPSCSSRCNCLPLDLRRRPTSAPVARTPPAGVPSRGLCGHPCCRLPPPGVGVAHQVAPSVCRVELLVPRARSCSVRKRRPGTAPRSRSSG